MKGQLASAPLYSSEEFDYGGTEFGRAYDPAEIVGDYVFAFGLELNYLGIERYKDFKLNPYIFYDIGKVYNLDTGGINESAASTGFGLKFLYNENISFDLGMAWPLTRPADNPLHGNGKNPRFTFNLDLEI